jgi:subtilisin family serine protease
MLNDGLTEGDETLYLQISSPINATINDGTGEGTILDDESGATAYVSPSFLTSATRQVDYSSIIENATRATSEDYIGGQLMVRFQPGYTDALKEAAIESLGGSILERFLMIDSVLIELEDPSSSIVTDINIFLSDPLVLYAEPNYRVYPLAIPDDSSFSTLWGLNNTGQTGGTVDADIDAVEAWDTFTGTSGSIVVVIDSGIDYTHPDLIDNMWSNPGEIAGNGIDDDGNGRVDDMNGYDFSDNDSDISDADGHGSHVAGTIGATGDNAEGVVGVNWDVSLLGAKIFPFASTSTVAGAVNYVTTMRQVHGHNITAINASYGGYFSTQTEYDSILAVNNAGVVFVAAAANDAIDNDTTPAYPASYDLPGIISVAATDDRDLLSSFSNYGLTSVDLGAPGGDQDSGRPGINSTVPTSVSPSGYIEYQGTSMASPQVAGAVGLIRGLNPSLTVQQATDAILSTVDQVTSLDGQVVTGGRLNLAAALAAVAPAPPPPPAGGGSGSAGVAVDAGDTMLGRSGNDTLIGAGGDDLMIAGGDRDTLSGGDGDDHQLAGSGDDLLNGDAGNDTLDGQGGADLVFGDAGDDVLVWQHGAGSDNLEGGDGYDVVHARDGGADSAFSVGENLLDLTYQMDARMQLADGTHTTNVGFSIAEVEFQPGDGDDTVIVTDLTHVPSLLLRVAGGPGNDVLSAAGADPGVVRLIFDGEAGNDTITGSVARDTIRGGDGDDLVLAGAGRDTVYGGDGDDVLNGNDGDDVMYGGVGFDTLNGDDGDDVLVGNEDRDLLVGGNGDDVLSGDQGRDTLNGKAGNDSLLGGEGTDRIYGGVGNDTLDGGRDNDSLYGNNGDDRLLGDHGDDSMKGGRGDDTLVGGDGHDQMFGERGDDQLGGGDGDDTLNGARGDDILLGGDGDDTMLAGSGADIVLGNQGDDYVKGQGGSRDTIAGGEGVDLVFGSVGEIDEAFRVSAALMSDLDAV